MADKKSEKLMPFKVIRTPKIRDSERKYVKRGETAMLTQELAEHYHEKGYIQVSMKGVFDDKDPKQSDDSGSSEANSGGTEPDQPTGGADEGTSSEDASADAGKGKAEDGEGVPPVSRRRRTSG